MGHGKTTILSTGSTLEAKLLFSFFSSCFKITDPVTWKPIIQVPRPRHLVNFLGTDTVASMICARDYYGAKKARGLITPKQTSHGCWLLEFIEEIILRIYRYYDEFACRSSSLSCFFFLFFVDPNRANQTTLRYFFNVWLFGKNRSTQQLPEYYSSNNHRKWKLDDPHPILFSFNLG